MHQPTINHNAQSLGKLHSPFLAMYLLEEGPCTTHILERPLHNRIDSTTNCHILLIKERVNLKGHPQTTASCLGTICHPVQHTTSIPDTSRAMSTTTHSNSTGPDKRAHILAQGHKVCPWMMLLDRYCRVLVHPPHKLFVGRREKCRSEEIRVRVVEHLV